MELETGLVFGTYDESLKNPVAQGQFVVYTSKEELEAACAMDRTMINLNNLIDRRCKKCNGKGNLGYVLEVNPDISVPEETILTKQDAKGIINYHRQQTKQVIYCKCVMKNLAKEMRERSRELLSAQGVQILQ